MNKLQKMDGKLKIKISLGPLKSMEAKSSNT